MAKLTNNIPNFNQNGRNMYGTSYFEPIMPDFPFPGVVKNFYQKATKSSTTPGKFGNTKKITGKGGIKVRGSVKGGK